MAMLKTSFMSSVSRDSPSVGTGGGGGERGGGGGGGREDRLGRQRPGGDHNI